MFEKLKTCNLANDLLFYFTQISTQEDTAFVLARLAANPHAGSRSFRVFIGQKA